MAVSVVSAQSQIGSLAANGGLARELPLASSQLGPISLSHSINPDGRGTYSVVSEWKAPALFTFAGPDGRKHIVWVRPGGQTERFLNKKIETRKPDDLIETWTAVSSGGQGDYTFYGRDGSIYVYELGQLRELTLPDGREFRIESDGPRITQIRQRHGEVALLQARYDDAGQLIQLKVGQVEHRFKYDREPGLLEAWQVMTSEYLTLFKYDDALLTKIIHPDGSEEHFKWRTDLSSYEAETGLDLPSPKPGALLMADDHFRYQWGINQKGINLVQIDQAGNRAGLIINPKTNEVTRINRDDGEQIDFYALEGENGAGKLREVRAPDGRKLLENRFDANHNLIYQKQAGKPAEIFIYDAHNRLISKGRTGQKQLTFEYPEDPELKKPIKVTNALGDSIEVSYDDAERVTAFRDLNGGLHRFEYDAVGRLVKRGYPMDYVATWTYDSYGNLVDHVDMQGNRTRFEYDEHGRMVRWTDGESIYSRTYDGLGRLAAIQRGGEVLQSIEQEVTAGGRVVQNRDEMGRLVEQEFDDLGRLQREQNALGETIDYNYNEAGDLLGWKDARGVEAKLERDEGGRISGIQNDLGQTDERAYNLAGRIKSRKTGEQTINYRHDREGRVVFIDYGKGQTVSYKYDDVGHLLEAKAGEVVTKYSYDAMDRVLGIEDNIPGGVSTRVLYRYAPGGQKASVRFIKLVNKQTIADATTSYHYDQLGRVTEVQLNQQSQVVYRYKPDQLKVAEKWYANGIHHRYSYDKAGRPLNVSAYNQSEELLRGIAYKWNDQGLLVGRTIVSEGDADDASKLSLSDAL
jgi:YD repeat-containing protein